MRRPSYKHAILLLAQGEMADDAVIAKLFGVRVTKVRKDIEKLLDAVEADINADIANLGKEDK